VPTGPLHLHIADVLTAVPANVGVEAGMVMLTEDEAPYRSLRIIIGQPEANAILAGWHGAVPGRPSTWDLFVSTVALLEGRIDRVVITAVHEERHYFAQIELEQGGERRILACRPSDAIALAVRGYNVDILAESAVLDAAGVLPDGSKPGAASDEPGDEAESPLAEREAALAAREAELAERERMLAAREGVASRPSSAVVGPPETDAPAVPDASPEGGDTVAGAPLPAPEGPSEEPSGASAAGVDATGLGATGGATGLGATGGATGVGATGGATGVGATGLGAAVDSEPDAVELAPAPGVTPPAAETPPSVVVDPGEDPGTA
jgi:bifunctional DNase/RNase